MPIAINIGVQQNQQPERREEEIKTGWLKASEFLKTSTKDVLKVIELTGEYATIAFKDIDDLFPVSTLIKAVKQAYSTLVWQDVSVSSTKWMHQAVVLNKKRDKESIANLTRATLGSLWDAQKLLKWVDKLKIVAINSVVLARMSILGGIAYFAKSSENAFLDGIEIQQLDLNNDKTKVRFQIIKVINNLAKAAIGAIVFANAAFSFVAPVPLILFIGTTIIGTNILKAYYKS
jgi:hypothetical protein